MPGALRAAGHFGNCERSVETQWPAICSTSEQENLQQTAEKFHGVDNSVRENNQEADSGECSIIPQRIGNQGWLFPLFLSSLPEDERWDKQYTHRKRCDISWDCNVVHSARHHPKKVIRLAKSS
jgi:hypothetical protein